MNNLLRVVDLYKSYYDGLTELPVLKGIDLEVKQAEIVAIVGASGVGKSTLLHLLGGLDRPTEGTIFYEGEDIFALNDQELDRFRNEEIGFVFQFHHLLPEFTALENVAMPGTDCPAKIRCCSGSSQRVARICRLGRAIRTSPS